MYLLVQETPDLGVNLCVFLDLERHAAQQSRESEKALDKGAILGPDTLTLAIHCHVLVETVDPRPCGARNGCEGGAHALSDDHLHECLWVAWDVSQPWVGDSWLFQEGVGVLRLWLELALGLSAQFAARQQEQVDLVLHLVPCFVFPFGVSFVQMRVRPFGGQLLVATCA